MMCKLLENKPAKEVIYVDPCPECGGVPQWQEVFFRYWILCKDCGFVGPKDLDFKRAIEKWNNLGK